MIRRGRGDGRRRWVVLSDGAGPTEDIYFVRAAKPWLEQRHGIIVSRWNTRRRRWLLTWALRRLRGANILICRSLAPAWLELLEAHRGQLGAIYYLIDDDLGAAGDDAALPEAYRQRLMTIAEQQQPRLLAVADEVIVSSSALRERFRGRHNRVTILTPPLIAPLPDLGHFSATPWRIGYHGTRAHRQDLAHIAPAIQRLHDDGARCTQQTLVFEVMLGRHTPANLRLLPRLSSPAPLSWQRFHRYRQMRRVHIGLAPLRDTAFNRGKSFIKFLDISAMGGVGIYSRRSPYAEVVEHGADGLLADDDPDDWYRCLCQLVDNPERTRQMARRAADKARALGNVERARRFWLERS